MTVATATAIHLEVGCHAGEHCGSFHSTYLQMASGRYDVCAAMPLPDSLDGWMGEHRTARKRCNRARSRGYFTAPLQRELRSADIHAINTSRDYRQGRPMSPDYQSIQEFAALPDYVCSRHLIRTTGVYLPVVGSVPKLVGYLTMYRVGDLALVSQILGHGDHERDEIMFLLFAGALERERWSGPGVCVYNRWDSGTDGLREFKARLGFEETEVEWLP